MSDTSVTAAAADRGLFNRPIRGSNSPPPAEREAPAADAKAKAAPEPEPVLEAKSPYRVRMDTETMRAITEVVDQVTGEVLFFLPPGYRPPEESAMPGSRRAPRADR